MIEQIKEKEIELISYKNEHHEESKHQAKESDSIKRTNKITNNAVNIDDLNIEKQPEDIQNCLEFLIITICRGFKSTPQQVYSIRV